jgi:hypothetical protein
MTKRLKSTLHGSAAAAVLASVLVACSDAEPVGPHGMSAGLDVVYSAVSGGAAFVILESPETSGWPVYTSPPAISAGGEVLIFLQRDPSCIPDDFNFFLGFAAEHPLACPLTMHTKEWWLPEDLELIGGPWGEPFWDPNLPIGTAVNPNFRTTFEARFDGDAVPVWVVSGAEFNAAVVPPQQPGDRPTLLIGVIRSMASRIDGTATHFHWVQHNSNRGNSTPSQRPNSSVAVASGTLEDGRSFRFHVQEVRNVPNHLEVVIQ